MQTLRILNSSFVKIAFCLSTYLSIYVRHLIPSRVATAELSPSLPVQPLPLSALQPSPTHFLFLQYSFTIYLLHWWSPPPSILLLYTLFVKARSFILITCPYHLSVLRFTDSTTPQSISTVSLTPNLPYVSSLLSIPPWHTASTPHATHFYSSYSWLLCCIPRLCLWCTWQCEKDNTTSYALFFLPPCLHFSLS